MIIDAVANSNSFSTLRAWPAVHAFLERGDLHALEAGRYDIDGDNLYAIIADEEHKEGANALEAHRAYIDVQVALEGSFNVLWRPLSSRTNLLKEYDEEKDYLLMSDEATTTLHLVPGIAAVFYPADAHAPQPPATKVRKIAFKVRLDS